jgi:hypothetical protein
VEVFKDIEQSVSLEGQGLDVRGFHGRTTTLSVPLSADCPDLLQVRQPRSTHDPDEPSERGCDCRMDRRKTGRMS